MGKKVCLISLCDFTGSGYRIKEAVNLTSNNDVEYICLIQTPWYGQFKRSPSLYKPAKIGYSMIPDDA